MNDNATVPDSSDITVEFRNRQTADGRPFGEMFHTVGAKRYYTRTWHPFDDNPMTRAQEIEAFRRRQRQEMT